MKPDLILLKPVPALSLLTLSTFSILLSGCGNAPLYTATRLAMGTTAVIEIPLGEEPLDTVKNAAEAALAEISRLESLYSIYDPSSEISGLNAAGMLEDPDPDTIFIIETAKEFGAMTGGAFDITVGGLESLWKGSAARGREPETHTIEEARSHAGMDKIAIDKESNVIRLADRALSVDLGGIAPGYAADRAAAVLTRCGVKNALINIGGEIVCLGERRDGRRWRIGIRDPSAGMHEGRAVPDGDSLIDVLALKNMAVSTSGDYENYFSCGGERYSHIIDPRTGAALNTVLSSVTVIAEDCITADALSTAISVLGLADGLELVENLPYAECYIVVTDGGRRESFMSSGIDKYMVKYGGR